MDNRKHITVVIGRHSLLALARGQEVHLNELDASAVVTLIPESFFPSKAILAALEPAATEPDKAGSKPSLPRYKATDSVPRDFLAIDGDRFPLCPKCGGEADLIARPKEAPVWICDCGWEQGAG
jgi:hypothetical protein